MKLLLIKTTAETHVYSHFIHALHEALAELGHEAIVSDQSVHVVNGVGPKEPVVAALQSFSPDAVISMSSFFGDIQLVDGRSLFDALGIKFVGWQVDHPIYAPSSLRPALKGRYAVYASRNHVRYAQAVKLPGRGIVLMPGGHAPVEPVKAYKQREWPIFVAATWNGVPQRLWEQAEDSPGKRLLTGVVDALLRDSGASLLEAFNTTSAKLKLGARLGDNREFDQTMHAFLRDPLTYVRHFDRISIIGALVEAGLPVTICGAGWREHFGERENVTYVAPVDFKDIQTLYGKSRIVLNLNAGNGGAERAVYAALAGAAVASDYGEQVDGLLKANRGVAFYNRARPETAAEVIGGLIESDKGEFLAQSGHDRAIGAGLWRHRAQQLVDFIQT